jgi:SAM-dependent methyltransferase
VRNDFDLVQRLDIILELCSGKRVLHLGCTNAPYTEEAIRDNMLLQFALEKVAADVWALDADRQGIEILESHGSKQILFGDLENLDDLDLDQEFDVIVAGEMIEHLNNPGSFIKGVKRFMNRDSILLLTTINAYCAMRFFYYGFRGRNGRSEPVHPDHVAYYSYSTLKVLLDRHDLPIDRFLYYDIGREHRPHTPWFLKLVNDLCVKVAPQWADGIIAICKLPR